MKKFCFFILFLTLFHISFSAPVINAGSNGNWNATSTWDLNRLPKIGDTIIIPSGKVVTINDDENFNAFVFIKVYGKLIFQNNNSTLSVNAPSVIIVFSNAQILGGGSASQKIKYDNSSIFQGNNDPINGPQMASVATSGFDAYFTSPLPVKFIGFTLKRKNNDALVQWATSHEINTLVYQVERSLDGNNWSTIAYFSAVGNNAATSNYSFTDKNISARVVYYRIKEVDVDGKAAYTTIKLLKSETTSVDEIKIGAAQNKVVLQFPQEIKGNIAVRFVSKNGQVLHQQTINNPVGLVVLNSKVSGNYIIAVSNGQDINTAKQVIL